MELIDFLIDKESKGLPMDIGEAMSKTNTWSKDKVGSAANIFRISWEKKNKNKTL